MKLVSVISQTENYIVKAGDSSVGEIPVVSVVQNTSTGNEVIKIGAEQYEEVSTQTDKVLCVTMLDADNNEYYHPVNSVQKSVWLAKDTGVYTNYGYSGDFYVSPFIPCYG